ncbi:Cytidylate kinase [Candidatus Gugararchaeum adminiculabundum]|nr:Cytidylate kinase [Candidatus Gugararchaeum adminiculabundum]
MIICISGLAGSGKSAIGDIVAKRLGLRHINFTFKDIAKQEGVDLMKMQDNARADKKIDLDLDAKIAEEARKGNCVVTTWLAPWTIKNADLKIWLDATQEVRAKRVAPRDGMTYGGALSHIKKRDEDNHRRYISLYKIDIYDHKNFDLILDTNNLPLDRVAEEIIKLANTKKKK